MSISGSSTISSRYTGSSNSNGDNSGQSGNDNTNNNNNDDQSIDGNSNQLGYLSTPTTDNHGTGTTNNHRSLDDNNWWNHWDGTDRWNGSGGPANLVVKGGTKIVPIVVPLICCLILAVVVIICLAKKYKKKQKLKSHLESQMSYDLEEDLFEEKKKSGEIGQKFPRNDTIAVVVENLNAESTKKNLNGNSSEYEENDKGDMDCQGGHLVKSFSGNGHLVKTFSGNGAGLAREEPEKRLISGNGSGTNFLTEDVQTNSSQNNDGIKESKINDGIKSTAWVETSEEGTVMKPNKKQHPAPQDPPDETLYALDNQSERNGSTKAPKQKQMSKKVMFESNKAPVTHLTDVDVAELEKLKRREKNSAKMLKKLRSVLNLVIDDDDTMEEDGRKAHEKEPQMVTKAELKQSQREIDSFLSALYDDDEEELEEFNNKNKNNPQVSNEVESNVTEESLCSWDEQSDTELEKEIATLFMKHEKNVIICGDRRSPDGAEVVDNNLCKAYVIWLIWCKNICTCGAFMDNQFGKESGPIEEELLRNAEQYMKIEKNGFPHKREFGFRVQVPGKPFLYERNVDLGNDTDGSWMKSCVNNEEMKKPKKKLRHRSQQGVLGQEIQHDSTNEESEDGHHSDQIRDTVKSGTKDNNLAQDNKVNAKGPSDSSNKMKQKKHKKKQNTKKRNEFPAKQQKFACTILVSEGLGDNYGNADVRKPNKKSDERTGGKGSNLTKVDVHFNATDEPTDDDQSSNETSVVMPFEKVRLDTDDSDDADIYVTGRSNPIGKKTHVDYVIDSDDEENFIVVRSSTGEYPQKEKLARRGRKDSPGAIPSISVVNVDEADKDKFGKGNVSQPKTLVSFEKSKVFTKCSPKKKNISCVNEENTEEQGNAAIVMGAEKSPEVVSVPFKSDLENEAKRKPRGMKQLSIDREEKREVEEKNENFEDDLFSDETKERKRRGSSSRRHSRNTDESFQNSTEMLNVREGDDDVFGRAMISTPRNKGSNKRKGASGKRQRHSQNRLESVKDEEGMPPGQKESYDEEMREQYTPSFVDASSARPGNRRASGTTSGNPDFSNHTTGNITIDDRNNPIRAQKTRSLDTGNTKDCEKTVVNADDDTDVLYFAGGEVLNVNIHKYEVTQAKPDTYGKATVIGHGKKK